LTRTWPSWSFLECTNGSDKSVDLPAVPDVRKCSPVFVSCCSLLYVYRLRLRKPIIFTLLSPFDWHFDHGSLTFKYCEPVGWYWSLFSAFRWSPFDHQKNDGGEFRSLVLWKRQL
jgi:hypothetical protein